MLMGIGLLVVAGCFPTVPQEIVANRTTEPIVTVPVEPDPSLITEENETGYVVVENETAITEPIVEVINTTITLNETTNNLSVKNTTIKKTVYKLTQKCYYNRREIECSSIPTRLAILPSNATFNVTNMCFASYGSANCTEIAVNKSERLWYNYTYIVVNETKGIYNYTNELDYEKR
jgi:hypothetical protein